MASTTDKMQTAIYRAWSLWIIPLIHVVVAASAAGTRAVLPNMFGRTGATALRASDGTACALWRWRQVLQARTRRGTTREAHALLPFGI